MFTFPVPGTEPQVFAGKCFMNAPSQLADESQLPLRRIRAKFTSCLMLSKPWSSGLRLNTGKPF